MKILTISTVKDVFCTLPVSEQQKIMKTAVKSILNVKKRLGDRVQFYGEIGWGRTVSIGDHTSVEEYVQYIQGDQARASCWNMETYLLSEVDEKALQAYVDNP